MNIGLQTNEYINKRISKYSVYSF